MTHMRWWVRGWFLIYFLLSPVYAMWPFGQAQDPVKRAVDEALKKVTDHLAYVNQTSNTALLRCNEALGLAYNSSVKSAAAFQVAKDGEKLLKETAAGLERVKNLPATLEQQAKNASAVLEHKAEQLCTVLRDVLKEERGITLDDRIKIEQSKSGIYEKIAVAVESEKWKRVRELLHDTRLMVKIGVAIVVIAVCIYLIKYALPLVLHHFTRPRVISETSRCGWFEKNEPYLASKHQNLIFTHELQQKLQHLVTRVQTAQKYNEGLPNVLFYGDPGTGKTAFVRLLAKESGLDYALTSGSEFAKITDLNDAINELRNLLQWAYESKKGLIVFIDEAESLFAHRNLHASSKVTQDFVNTFLSLIPDQSQKKVMFIFATNHPFKLDDAITNRIGMSVEFTLPAQAEREKILTLYMNKAAQESKYGVVTISPDVQKSLAAYAKRLEGFSPRTLKFLAEEIIACARRSTSLTVTIDNIQTVISEAQRTKEQFVRWEKERDAWTASYSPALGHRAEC